jgi:hypothetical protein
VTCLVATKAKGVIQSAPDSAEDKFLDVIHLRTPAELVVFTLFVHKDIPLLEVPTAGLFGQLKMGPASHKTATDQKLPITVDVETFQPTPNSLAFLEFPGHGKAVLDAIELAQQRMGREGGSSRTSPVIGFAWPTHPCQPTWPSPRSSRAASSRTWPE